MSRDELAPRLLRAVFVLPDAPESGEFMRASLGALAPTDGSFAEQLSGDSTRVAVPWGEDDPMEMVIEHLGPADALEDVQRRARKAAASLLRRWAISWGREFGQEKPPVYADEGQSFTQVTTLPQVDCPSDTSSTLVAYLVRPFGSAKDAERQLGPICIVEASYHGAGNSKTAQVPKRIVVALEEPDGGVVGAAGLAVPQRSTLGPSVSAGLGGASAPTFRAVTAEGCRPASGFGRARQWRVAPAPLRETHGDAHWAEGSAIATKASRIAATAASAWETPGAGGRTSGAGALIFGTSTRISGTGTGSACAGGRISGAGALISGIRCQPRRACSCSRRRHGWAAPAQ